MRRSTLSLWPWGNSGVRKVDEFDPERIARMMTVNLTWPATAVIGGSGSVTATGSRAHHCAVLGGRNPGAALQLRLWLRQGRS